MQFDDNYIEQPSQTKLAKFIAKRENKIERKRNTENNINFVSLVINSINL